MTTAFEHLLPEGYRLAHRYVLGPLIGEPGGQGAVYKGWDDLHGRYIAVKIIHPGLYRALEATDKVGRRTGRMNRAPAAIRGTDVFWITCSDFADVVRRGAESTSGNPVLRLGATQPGCRC